MNKQKGWHVNCVDCQLFNTQSRQCNSENADGVCPCEVMSKKQFDYLVKQAESD